MAALPAMTEGASASWCVQQTLLQWLPLGVIRLCVNADVTCYYAMSVMWMDNGVLLICFHYHNNSLY